MLRIDAVSIFYSRSGDLLQAHAQRRSHDATRTRKTVLSHVSRNNPHPTIFFPFQTGDRVRAKIYLKTLFNFSDRPPSGIGDYFHHPKCVLLYIFFTFSVVHLLFPLQLQTYMVWIPADKASSCSLPPVPRKTQTERSPPSKSSQSRMNRNFGQFAGLYQTTYQEEIARTPFLRRNGTN